MKRLSNAEKRDFLIAISKTNSKLRKKTNVTLEEAYVFWYGKYSDPYDAAIYRAYLTFSRQLEDIGNNHSGKIAYQEANDYLKSNLENLSIDSQTEFDEWHRQAVDKLIDIYCTKYNQKNFCVGKAQKWINMAIKHLYIIDDKLVENFYRFAHIPIDHKIMEAMKSGEYLESLKDIDCSFGTKQQIAPWSKITSYEQYYKFQTEFREKCGKEPLDAEYDMWLKQKKEDDAKRI